MAVMAEVAVERVTYTARCVRAGDWWAIIVPEVPGVFSQARRLDQAEEMARDAIAAMLRVSPRSFDVRVCPDLPGGIGAEIDAAKELRQVAERAQREATAATWHVAATLLERHQLTMRDIGSLLGMSHQRVSQLLERSGRGAE